MKKKTITSTGTAINANDLSEEEYQSEIKVDTEEGQMYHPLDMVNLVDYSSGFPIHIQVPVIFVKALASEAELKDINRNIRIGFDFLAIMAGLAIAFTTANPGALALALADITLATGDVAVQDAVKELEKTPEGREFLETWEKIYMVGGVLLAGPALIETVMIKGARLLNFVKTTTSAKFLKTCLLKVLLEIEIANFTKNTVKIIDQNTEIITATSGALDKYKLGHLQEKGILLIAGDVKKANKISSEYGLLYKERIVAKGDRYTFYKQIKDVARNYYKDEKLVDILDEMEDDVWKYFDKERASGSKYPTKSLENMYATGSKAEFEKGVKYLTEKEREAYEVFVQHDKIVDAKGNLVDTNGSVSIFDGQPNVTEKAIFVMSEDGKLYLSKNYEFGKFHHSSFLAGKPVSAAGEIMIEKGIIKIVDNGSGHYKPLLNMVEDNILRELNNRGYFSIGTNKKIEFKNGF